MSKHYSSKANFLRSIGVKVSYKGRESQNTSQAKSAVSKAYAKYEHLRTARSEYQFVKGGDKTKANLQNTFRHTYKTEKGIWVRKPIDPATGKPIKGFKVQARGQDLKIKIGRRKAEELIKVSKKSFLKSGEKYLYKLLAKKLKGKMAASFKLLIGGQYQRDVLDISELANYLSDLFSKSGTATIQIKAIY